MRIAVLQAGAVNGDVAANLQRIGMAAAEASLQDATLLIAPELATTGYGAGDAIQSLAEAPDGPQATTLRQIARDNGLAIVTGFAERGDDGKLYNSALFVDSTGPRACYRKCQLWGPYERALFTAGPPEAVCVNYGGIKIGLLICYDVEFPERVRALARAGADLIAVPTATPSGEAARFISSRMIPVRAFENQLFIAYANHHGHDGRFAYAGSSCIAAPDGGDLARAEEAGDAFLLADIDPGAFAQSRAENPYLNDLTG